MLRYRDVKRNKREFLALTGLTLKEYKLLLPAFSQAYARRHEGPLTLSGQPRQRKVGAGRSSGLDDMEQKLLFILVYQKTYPLQAVMGALFEISQSSANMWIHRLLPVLKDALTDLGLMPEREGAQFAFSEQHEQRAGETPEYIIDGTERRRQRPKSLEMQAVHYSGKKKQHTDKNIIISHVKTGRVGYLSPTRPGTVHDKKLAEHEHIRFPSHSVVHKDTGFQGYEPPVKQTLQPPKSQKAKN